MTMLGYIQVSLQNKFTKFMQIYASFFCSNQICTYLMQYSVLLTKNFNFFDGNKKEIWKFKFSFKKHFVVF